ncbi:MAG TPA: hypothetical protein VGS11_05325 [Candidatus Bathyarchaeia archaeon]|nr:hypothetical protein [Candidatus Bathyarchaeia archaeon]
MDEEISIARLRAEPVARRAGLMVRVQSVIILLLTLWMAEQYNTNQYFQDWATRYLGMLGFMLGGSLVALYAGVLIAVCLRRPMPPVNRRQATEQGLIVADMLTE